MWQRNHVVLPDGRRIRFALYSRPERTNDWYVRFKGPEGQVRRGTGQVKKAAAIDAAQQIILEAYGQAKPVVVQSQEGVCWEEAEERLKEEMEADGKRPNTIKGYLETLGKLKAMFTTKGPAEVTPELAARFKTKYATESHHGKKHEAKSVHSRVVTLKAVFSWLRDLKLVKENPFSEVMAPKLDRHEVKYVSSDDVQHFYDWLGNRYPGWAMPQLFFDVKALTGCRLEDLCNLRSVQLQDGRLVFPADVTKNRSERYAILPEDVYAALESYKGETYLWERYPAELIAANVAKGFPVHRQNPEFSPGRLYRWVEQTMQTYQKETGRDFSSHDFRKAAFTRAAEADINPKRAAAAFDVTPEVMMRYYTGTEKKRTADEVLGGLAEKLRLKKNGERER